MGEGGKNMNQFIEIFIILLIILAIILLIKMYNNIKCLINQKKIIRYIPERKLNVINQLKQWHRTAEINQHAHYKTRDIFIYYHYVIGITVILFASITGAVLFTSLLEIKEINVQIGTGIISILAAFFAGLQTFLRCPEHAEAHRSAGAQYGNLKRKIGRQIICYNHNDNNPSSYLDPILTEFEGLTTVSPAVSNRLWKKVRSQIDSE